MLAWACIVIIYMFISLLGPTFEVLFLNFESCFCNNIYVIRLTIHPLLTKNSKIEIFFYIFLKMKRCQIFSDYVRNKNPSKHFNLSIFLVSNKFFNFKKCNKNFNII